MRVAKNNYLISGRIIGPDFEILCSLMNTCTYTRTHTERPEVFVASIIDPPLGGPMRVA